MCDHVVYPAYLDSPRLFGLSSVGGPAVGAGALNVGLHYLLFLIPAAQIHSGECVAESEVHARDSSDGRSSPAISNTLWGIERSNHLAI